eukprot:CAMPEP_0175213326 /NCGR_PEP_ID=MMETSP0093-20121207/16132_1 /TAXON_ID=311494 /ORGANISM="Alexandrium monilatum, Strain CCMP3105" /LENGTH=114 /DNA_ID=CAMNT_0016506641 /DNA_START=118 /DNA_END=462 /DNA_ORIENTATION=+
MKMKRINMDQKMDRKLMTMVCMSTRSLWKVSIVRTTRKMRANFSKRIVRRKDMFVTSITLMNGINKTSTVVTTTTEKSNTLNAEQKNLARNTYNLMSSSRMKIHVNTCDNTSNT